MKLLFSTSDLRELTGLVKRLLHVGIPCAVCKESGNSLLSVWIQQDSNFPQALRIFADRDRPRPLPPWVCLLDKSLPATEESAGPADEDATRPANEESAGLASEAGDVPNVVLVQSKGPTLTGTTGLLIAIQ